MRPSHTQSADSHSSPARAPKTGTATREFRLYNTMTRSDEPFAPADGETVRIYSCGPTVYNPAHLGNFRTFLFVDLLRRTLRLRGWKVRQVMNLTDVDDKIIRRAHEQRKTIREVTEPMTAIFHADREYLRIERAEDYPKATDYIPQMIALVEELIDARRRVSGGRPVGVFRDRSVPGVRPAVASRHARGQGRRARRAGRLLEGERAGLRALESGDARTTRRPARRGTHRGAAAVPAGTSSARRWRSTCWARRWTSTAAASISIFPHHEDEIAQSEAATGQTFSRVLVPRRLPAHRRREDGQAARQRDDRAGDARSRHHRRRRCGISCSTRTTGRSSTCPTTRSRRRSTRCAGWGTSRIGWRRRLAVRRSSRRRRTQAVAEVEAALFDDLNAPNALAALFTFITRANAELDRRGIGRRGARPGAGGVRADQRRAWTSCRTGKSMTRRWFRGSRSGSRRAESARARRDFAEADRIRAELVGKGIAIEDAGGRNDLEAGPVEAGLRPDA